MGKLFVVLVQPLTADEEKQLASRLPQPIGWWHHLPNSWLIVDPMEGLSAAAIRQIIEDISPAKHSLVLEVDLKDWASRQGADDEERVDWLRKHWN
jgi:hypothetical protein